MGKDLNFIIKVYRFLCNNMVISSGSCKYSVSTMTPTINTWKISTKPF